jgi:hypothetical protein
MTAGIRGTIADGRIAGMADVMIADEMIAVAEAVTLEHLGKVRGRHVAEAEVVPAEDAVVVAAEAVAIMVDAVLISHRVISVSTLRNLCQRRQYRVCRNCRNLF